MISSVQPVTQLKKPENTSHQRLESDRERQGTGVDEGEEKKKDKNGGYDTGKSKKSCPLTRHKKRNMRKRLKFP